MMPDSADATPLTSDALKMMDDRTSGLKGTESVRTSLTSVDSLEQDLMDILGLEDLMDDSLAEQQVSVVTRRASSCSIAPRRPSLKRASTIGSTRRNSAPLLKRNVSFDKVKVREFQQVMGENPPQDGPSIGLGWNYTEKKELDVDKFESRRNSVSLFRKSRRDSSKESLSLSPSKREKLARKLGYSQEEIEKNMRQVQRCQQRRKQTVKQLQNLETGLDAMEIFKAAQRLHGRS